MAGAPAWDGVSWYFCIVTLAFSIKVFSKDPVRFNGKSGLTVCSIALVLSL